VTQFSDITFRLK